MMQRSEPAGKSSGSAIPLSELGGQLSEIFGQTSESSGQTSESSGQSSDRSGHLSEPTDQLSELVGQCSLSVSQCSKSAGQQEPAPKHLKPPVNVWNDFIESFRSSVSAQLGEDVRVTMLPPTRKHYVGDIGLYTYKTPQLQIEELMNHLTTVDRWSWAPRYLSISLKKDLWTPVVIKEIMASGSLYGLNSHLGNTIISVSMDGEDGDDSITLLRMKLLKTAIVNLVTANGCVICREKGRNFIVSRKYNNDPDLILCGNVVGKPQNMMTVHNYELQRTKTVKVSRHSFDPDKYPEHVIECIVRASMVVDLLSVRHNKVVHLQFEDSNIVGIFIMYNYSRLSQVMVSFKKSVVDGRYEALPDIDVIDFGLLITKEEWFLILNFLSTFPTVVQESVAHLTSATIDVHKLCKFLDEMSSAVSSFYHRHHILSDPVPSLMPLLYARIYLVKALMQVYENSFRILGIEPVNGM